MDTENPKVEHSDIDKSLLRAEVIDALNKRYEIVDWILVVYHDIPPTRLSDRLRNHAGRVFSSQQRIVVMHFDLDYYPSLTSNGNFVYNFFRLCANYDIALDKIIFLHNHPGLTKEILQTAESICFCTDIKIICTHMQCDLPNVSDIKESELAESLNNLTYLYSCLNGRRRMHRLFTLCALKEQDLLSQGMLSYHWSN